MSWTAPQNRLRLECSEPRRLTGTRRGCHPSGLRSAMWRTSFSGVADEAGRPRVSGGGRRCSRCCGSHTCGRRWGRCSPRYSGRTCEDVLSDIRRLPVGMNSERGRCPQGALGFDEACGVAGHTASLVDISPMARQHSRTACPCVCRGLLMYFDKYTVIHDKHEVNIQLSMYLFRGQLKPHLYSNLFILSQ